MSQRSLCREDDGKRRIQDAIRRTVRHLRQLLPRRSGHPRGPSPIPQPAEYQRRAQKERGVAIVNQFESASLRQPKKASLGMPSHVLHGIAVLRPEEA